MRGTILVTSVALLLTGTFAASAQTATPQEPRGEESSRSSTPSGQLAPTPGESRAQSSGETTQGMGPRGNGTPQEPRGEESSQSANPRGQQQPRRE